MQTSSMISPKMKGQGWRENGEIELFLYKGQKGFEREAESIL